MDVVLDGETVMIKLKPVFGYLHRNHEKIAENTTIWDPCPYTDRLDYFFSPDQQLGLRPDGGTSCRTSGAGRAEYRGSSPPERPAPKITLPSGLAGSAERTWGP